MKQDERNLMQGRECQANVDQVQGGGGGVL